MKKKPVAEYMDSKTDELRRLEIIQELKAAARYRNSVTLFSISDV